MARLPKIRDDIAGHTLPQVPPFNKNAESHVLPSRPSMPGAITLPPLFSKLTPLIVTPEADYKERQFQY